MGSSEELSQRLIRYLVKAWIEKLLQKHQPQTAVPVTKENQPKERRRGAISITDCPTSKGVIAPLKGLKAHIC